MLQRSPRRISITDLANQRALFDAWTNVLANDLDDGVLSADGRTFAADSAQAISALSVSLMNGTYLPSALRPIDVPKDDGRGVRTLHVPTVADRVVERALVDLLTPLIDPTFSPWSFGFRPGIAVADAINALTELRDEGNHWAVRTDVRDCFGSLDRDSLLRQMRRWCDDDCLRVLGLLFERPVADGGVPSGLPQGGPLSPLLANVTLDAFDRRLARKGIPCVRFADDLTLLAVDERAAHDALEFAMTVAEDLGLGLSEEKTRVMPFTEGFAFLGEEIGPTYPAAPATVNESPSRRALYVGVDGATVRMQTGQVVVSRHDEDLLAVPSTLVGSITLFGAVGLSAGARQHALASDVHVCFVSRRGRLQGWLEAGTSTQAARRRRQYARADDDAFATGVASRFVAGKITNMRALLLRRARRSGVAEVHERADALEGALDEALGATSVAACRGIEGAATRTYFEGVRFLLPEWAGFARRERQPPPDAANAALSFGYAVLLGHAVSAVAAAGLDPACGFLHDDDGARPSLALDLIEEFRPAVIDTVVLEAFRSGRLSPASFRFEQDRGATLLTEAGRRTVVTVVETRMLTTFHHVPSKQRVSYRRAMLLQARQIAACVATGDPTTYRAVAWR